MKTCFRNLKRWPFATVMSARKYGCDNIFAPHGAELGSQLCMAILRGDNLEVKRMLAAGAPPDYQDEPDGWTPLIYSVYYRNPAAWELLLERDADPGRSDFSGRTPLMVAAIVDDDASVRRLLAIGADAGSRDCRGKTALDFAREFRSRNCAVLLEAARKTPEANR
ncbi:MAG: ankyrin repeat domain-containing protein [Lentisphaeria bacterium]|nr:ankyrin repeat domain-containing protein [Lentisphaeria bacterium]